MNLRDLTLLDVVLEHHIDNLEPDLLVPDLDLVELVHIVQRVLVHLDHDLHLVV